MIKLIKIILVVLFIGLVSGCNKATETRSAPAVKLKKIDLQQIKSRGVLNVVTEYNSINYYIFNGKPRGFQYELLKAFADEIGVTLNIEVNNDVDKNIEGLLTKQYDVYAANLIVTSNRKEVVSFTNPIIMSPQVLVQRKSDYNSAFAGSVHDLGGDTIYLPKGSPYAERVENLAEEIGEDIVVVETPEYGVEQLIIMVAKGEIDYTVCEECMARVNQFYYNEIDISTKISLKQKLSWAVRADAPKLLHAVNNWLEAFTKKIEYRWIYDRYYNNPTSYYRMQSELYSYVGDKISVYDNLFKQKSVELEWDWRLLASLVYQESKFKENAQSWRGAYGLMQLMPETSDYYGVVDSLNPEENIAAGIRYIKDLQFMIDSMPASDEHKLKFILAAYNVGLGHVLDARRLALKNGKDPNVWDDNVEFYLLMKSKPRFYTDSVVRHGYCRGKEPVNYVAQVMERYHHYQNLIAR